MLACAERPQGLLFQYKNARKFCSILSAFVFKARPVIPIADAVRAELDSIALRDGLEGK